MAQTDKTTPRVRGTTPAIEAAARQLRQNMTPAEQRLWGALRNKQLDGLKFRSQHPVGPFILDFWCPACKLVVEVDGDIHDYQTEADTAQTQQLEVYGYRVLRFRNQEVMDRLPEVLARIRQMTTQPP